MASPSERPSRDRRRESPRFGSQQASGHVSLQLLPARPDRRPADEETTGLH